MPINMSTGAINFGSGPNPQWGLNRSYRGGNTTAPAPVPTPSVSQPPADPAWETGIGQTPHYDQGPGSVGGSHNTAGNAARDNVGIDMSRWSRGPNPGWGRPRGGWGGGWGRGPSRGAFRTRNFGQPMLQASVGTPNRVPPAAAGGANRAAQPRFAARSNGRGFQWDSSVPTRIGNNQFEEGGAVPHLEGGGTFTTWSNPPGTPPPNYTFPYGAVGALGGPPNLGALGGGPGGVAPGGSRSTSTSTSRGGSTSGSFLPDYIQEPFLMQLAQYAQDHASDLFGRYADAFAPLEDELIEDSRTYASPERIRSDMGRAGATVKQAMEGNREAALQRLTDYGINVNSGRFAGLNRAEAAQAGAAQAGAENMARVQDEEIARRLRSEALGLGSRNLSAGIGLTNIASQLRYPPLGNASSSWNASDSNQSSQSQQASSGGGGGGGSRGGSGNRGGGDRGNPRDPARPNDPGDPGNGWVGSSDGPDQFDNPYYNGNTGNTGDIGGQIDDYNNWYDDTIGGSDFSYLDDADFVGDTTFDGGSYSGWGDFFGNDMGESFAEGGAIDMDYQGGDDPNATTGGFVSRSLSPSGGKVTDDVPARLNADEFVIPRDVTMWKGQEFFQNLIMKSRQARTGAPAKPTMKAPGSAPAINMGV